MASDTPHIVPTSQPAQQPKPLRKPLIKKFDLYIIKNFLGTFFFAILLLMAIVIVFDINEKLDAVLTAPVHETVFKYFMNFLPFIASQFSPLFTFISVIFFTSRLADRSEIIAMLSSGISFKRLAMPYLFSAAIIALGSFLLSAFVIPPANIKRIEYTNQWVKNKAVTYGDNIQLQVRPGVMAYIARYDNVSRTGFRFSLEQFDGKTLRSRLTAESVSYDTLGRWHANGYEIRDFDGLKETMRKGASIDTVLGIEPRDFLISKNDEQTLTSPQLNEYIARQKQRGVAGIKSFEIEYESRFAMIAAAFILTIIGLSLSSRKVRGGMGMNIGIGLLLSFSYILFMTVTQTFAVSGYTSARVAMWIPNLVYSLIAIYLYRRASR
ncbi:MAG: LptF/LptG family permease [Muribaculaceae bacterium]|jgi:lipopolysaccharide export system permease protein|nr:LptF/LptG family permease [Muribaculaceae bacterium]MBQ4006553.1 LptF/LptG family permease [Muribaculaceae bacterium]